jgi:hypothetical protein
MNTDCPYCNKPLTKHESLRLSDGELCHEDCLHLKQYHGISSLYKINLNDTVFVRLTERGRKSHKKYYEEFFKSVGLPQSRYTAPAEDEEGFSQWQLHDLAFHFGKDMSIGVNTPLETTIYVKVEP